MVALFFRGYPKLKIPEIAFVLRCHIVHDIKLLHHQISEYPRILFTMDRLEYSHITVVWVPPNIIARNQKISEIHFELIKPAINLVPDRK